MLSPNNVPEASHQSTSKTELIKLDNGFYQQVSLFDSTISLASPTGCLQLKPPKQLDAGLFCGHTARLAALPED